MQTKASKSGPSGKRTLPKSFEEYLTPVPRDARAALERLRKTIKAAAPGAEEVISYRIPMFRYHGRPLVSFAAFEDHCSFFVMSPVVMDAHKDELKGHDTSKGTIRFAADKPLPVALIKRLVKARIKENEGASGR